LVTPGGADQPQFFLFPDATFLFWAEEVAELEGIPVEVVPAPVESDDLCALALRTLPAWVASLTRLLEAEGIPLRRHPPR
jgi:hypothetical protein